MSFYCKKLLIYFMGLSLLSSCNKLPQIGPATTDSLATASQEECGFVQNSYGQRVSWKSSLPVRFVIHNNFPAEFEESLKNAAKKWEDAAGMSLFIFERTTETLSDIPSFDSRNIVYFLNEWNENQSGLQAVTTLKWYQNNIIDSDIKVDGRFFNFYTTSAKSYGEIHMESLLIHELGHVLGMKHKTNSPTVMWATLSGATERVELSETDKASLKCEYQ